jgi:hypothetical protein
MSVNPLVADGSPDSAETHNVTSTQYLPLPHDGDSFRLLRVLPSPISTSTIRCELYTASISREEDKYIAGSYVWGPSEPSKSIVINGKSFQVRSNLFRFLRAFRSRRRSQVIWIDAVCINQDDIQERGHQVQEMKRIYSNAKCVYCWLHLDNAMPYNSIFNLHRVIDLVHWRRRDNRRRMRQEKQADYLVRAEYWSRIWIVQEFLLAKDLTLLMGSHRLSARRLKSILRDWTEGTPDLILYSTARFLVDFRQGEFLREFESTFWLFSNMQCSLPQDAVFALLGLVGKRAKDMELIGMIDYSLTVWQLLQRILAQNILQEPFYSLRIYDMHLLKNQEDNHMHMHDVVNMQLQYHAHWPLRGSDDSRYADLDGSCLRMALALPTDGSSRLGEYGVILAVHTQDRHTVLERTVASFRFYPSTQSFPAAYILTEACDSQCSTACVSHRIVGFSWMPEYQHLAATELVDLPLLMRDTESMFPEFISRLSSKFTAILQITNTKLCVIKDGSGQYLLEADLETMVKLSDFGHNMRRSYPDINDIENLEYLSDFTKGVVNDWPNERLEAH